MSRKINFTKMHGAGNDFILIQNNAGDFRGDEYSLIKSLCHRQLGIGADGLMLVDFIDPKDFNLRYYNADGNESTMCGNGARCAVYFVHQKFPDTSHFSFKIAGQTYCAEVVAEERVRLEWNYYPEIKNVAELRKIIPEEYIDGLFVDSGVPHLILDYPESVDHLDVSHWGPFFRKHPFFAPQGTNVNFISEQEEYLEIRTYERGVEGETLACGTGVLAAAVACQHWGKRDFPIRFKAKGGTLEVGTMAESGHLWLEGPVKQVFTGEISINNFRGGIPEIS